MWRQRYDVELALACVLVLAIGISPAQALDLPGMTAINAVAEVGTAGLEKVSAGYGALAQTVSSVTSPVVSVATMPFKFVGNVMLRVLAAVASVTPYPIRALVAWAWSFMPEADNPVVFFLMLTSLRKQINYYKSHAHMLYKILTGDGREAACDLCDEVITSMMDIEDAKDEADDDICDDICPFALRICMDMCGKLMKAIQSSSKFPCEAIGVCPTFDDDGAEVECKYVIGSGCSPRQQCMLTRQFPTPMCDLKPGYKQWKKQKEHMLKNIGQLSAAIQSLPKCGQEGASELFCVNEATGFSLWCEYAGYAMVFVLGTFNSIRAIETKGGDDDRQWLSFWIIFFIFSCIERISSILLSHIPIYYELKLAAIVWLFPPFFGAKYLYEVVILQSFKSFRRSFILHWLIQGLMFCIYRKWMEEDEVDEWLGESPNASVLDWASKLTEEREKSQAYQDIQDRVLQAMRGEKLSGIILTKANLCQSQGYSALAKLSETANCEKLKEAAKKAAADAEKDKAAATQAAKGKDEAKKTAAKDAAAKSQAAADEAQALYTEAKAAADAAKAAADTAKAAASQSQRRIYSQPVGGNQHAAASKVEITKAEWEVAVKGKSGWKLKDKKKWATRAGPAKCECESHSTSIKLKDIQVASDKVESKIKFCLKCDKEEDGPVPVAPGVALSTKDGKDGVVVKRAEKKEDVVIVTVNGEDIEIKDDDIISYFIPAWTKADLQTVSKKAKDMISEKQYLNDKNRKNYAQMCAVMHVALEIVHTELITKITNMFQKEILGLHQSEKKISKALTSGFNEEFRKFEEAFKKADDKDAGDKSNKGEIGDKTKAEFKMIFNFIDKNNNNRTSDEHITASELETVMKAVFEDFHKTNAAANKEKGNMSSEGVKNMVKAWILACDVDKNETLDFGEFEKLITRMKHGDGEFGEMGQKVYGHLLMLARFDLYDVDGDGKISKKEFYGSKLNFDKLDQDGNGISKDKFNSTFTEVDKVKARLDDKEDPDWILYSRLETSIWRELEVRYVEVHLKEGTNFPKMDINFLGSCCDPVVTMHLRNDYPLELEGKNLLKIGYQLENEQTAKKIVEMFDKKPGKAIPIEGWLDENENPFQLHELLEKLPEKLDGKLCKLASLLGLGKNHKTATEEEVGKLVDELRKLVDDPARYRKKSKKSYTMYPHQSVIQWKQRNPVWNNIYQIPITSGDIDLEGNYHNEAAPFHTFVLHLFDADFPAFYSKGWDRLTGFPPEGIQVHLSCLLDGRHHEFLYEWDYDDKAGVAPQQTASISFSLRFAS